ncbi:hypothetical protein ACOKM5_21950 [Streptomyces sp. BH097]|uniref:hypothetical protein n=1 Tax=unclassified Streptomyces TaxID=2593676 RepID=UPI003BB6738C
MTEQEWLDSVAAQLPERDLEWVLDLARICSTQWTADKAPTGETVAALGGCSVSPDDTESAVHQGTSAAADGI